ncbi:MULTISPECIES: hypothetical protein [Rhodococcus]|uniref:hypothetical protein n=1 Tax=Rhodococcus TaxID=1827 RepID=UPI00135CF6AE|nr:MULTISPECIES: hypothetical protein [Rhodococcus]KAF0956747.1 hypothetical protein MLGJGCBP_10155 [Rhodococcus sp. T7]KAF0966595.1 hypothetical protein MLGJGCBP_00270 [Rhodococcus sp. T7]UOT08357.1 hypothetical protein MPY17_39375 [Rhodococcus opacus]
MNVYTPDRYDESVVHLALGVELRDAISGRRLGAGADVRMERFPRPVGKWRPWRLGETLTAVLPRMHRHHTGRFVSRYDEGLPTTVDLRVVDDDNVGATRIAGLGRRIVPRRVRITIADEADVLAAEADPTKPPHPLFRRSVPLWCMPGSAADLPSRATVMRGRIVRLDAGSGALVPVRWARVRAQNATGDDVGWAHGDDRGEFALVVEQSANDIVVPADPVPISLTIGATLPAPTPDPADPLRASVDPLWDLPLETVVTSPTPEVEASLTGRRFLPGQAQLSPLNPPQPVDLPHGRETSVVIRIA